MGQLLKVDFLTRIAIFVFIFNVREDGNDATPYPCLQKTAKLCWGELGAAEADLQERRSLT